MKDDKLSIQSMDFAVSIIELVKSFSILFSIPTRLTKKNATELFRYERVVWLRFFFILSIPQNTKEQGVFLALLC